MVYLTDKTIDHHADAMDATRYGLMELGQRVSYEVITLPSGLQVAG